MGERFLCCHIVTAAAFIGALQLVVVLGTLAGSGMMLDRWDAWKAKTEPLVKARAYGSSLGTVDAYSKIFSAKFYANYTADLTKYNDFYPDYYTEEASLFTQAYLQLSLGLQLGFCTAWLVSLAFYAAAFKCWKPVCVLPNLFILILAIIAICTVLSAVMDRFFDPDGWFRTDGFEESILIHYFDWNVFALICALIALVCDVMFYSFLTVSGVVIPK